jgi:hypothetical protein
MLILLSVRFKLCGSDCEDYCLWDVMPCELTSTRQHGVTCKRVVGLFFNLTFVFLVFCAQSMDMSSG